MAVGINVVTEKVIGTYDDRITRAIKDSESKTRAAFKSMATAAKAFVGVLLAREVKQAFRELLNFSREYNTEASESVRQLDLWKNKLFLVIANSNTWRSVVQFISDRMREWTIIIANFSNIATAGFDLLKVKSAIWIEEFRQGIFGILEELHPVLMLAGKIRDALVPQQPLGELYGDLLSKQLAFSNAVEQGRDIATGLTPTKIEGPEKAPEEFFGISERNRRKLLREAHEENLKFEKKFADERIAALNAEYEKKKEIENAAFEEKQRLRKLEAEIAKQDAIDQIELAEKVKQRKIQTLETTAQFFGSISELIRANSKKDFLAYKIAAIAEATVATYAAASKALPNIPLAVLVTAIGLANVAKIASTNYGSKGSGGSSSSGISSRRDFGSQSQESGPTNIVNLRLQIGEQVGLAIKEAVEKGLSKDIKLERLAF